MKKQGVVEPLLPVTIGPGRIPLAGGTRAGDWVFADGVMATDDRGNLAREALPGPRPLSGLPHWYREARCLCARAGELLAAGGTDFAHAVRSDQYFPDWRAVPFMHQARREACGSYIAPSTTVLEPRLRLPGAAMAMEMIAVTADGAK